MLAYLVFFAAVAALAAGTILEGGLAFARVSARQAAERYAETGFAQARARLVAALAADVQAGTAPAAPAPLPPSTVCPDEAQRCPFTVAASFALAGSVGGAGAPNAVATNLQTHPAIAEGRVAASVLETIAAADGTPLVTRTEYVTLRTLAVPPYAMVEGTSDAAGARDSATAADAAGCDPANLSACDANNGSGAAAAPAPAGSMVPSDTRIHALERCVDGGSGACAGRTYVLADPPNAPPSTPWYDADAATGAWTR